MELCIRYLLYGYEDPKILDWLVSDWLNGQKDQNGVYLDHSTKTYPYINGGFYGEVVERNGYVDPQPRALYAAPTGQPRRWRVKKRRAEWKEQGQE